MIRMRTATSLGMALAVAAAALGGAAGSATAQSLRFATCKGNPTIGCANLIVPLDHADPTKGMLSLAIQRRKASGTRKGVIIMLAGGPGQAAFALSPFDRMPAALPNWDYIVLDQRGTGKGGALRCAAFDTPLPNIEDDVAVAQCAQQLDPNRAYYGTRQSVLDLEDLRVGLGVATIALGGVSYGTYVAQYYAQTFPTLVSHLVLDSVVDPANMDGLGTDTFGAVTPVLKGLCTGTMCKGITTDPVADLSALVARTADVGLTGTGGGPKGTPVVATIGGPKYPGDLPGYLMAGDLNPSLRALWPGAVKAALKGDPGPMIRIAGLAEYGEAAPVTAQSTALYIATTCADNTSPWTSGDSTALRTANLDAAFAAAGPPAFAPFSIANARASSSAQGCLAWPEAATDTLAPGPLPAIPTLLLSGGQDIRTPTANATAVARRSPAASIVVAPGFGHDLSDNLNCAADQVARLLAAKAVNTGACAGVRVQVMSRPIPAPAATVSALSPMGAKGTAGRVAHAARFSIQEAFFALDAGLSAGLTGIPGVRSGLMQPSGPQGSQARFRAYSDTKGVAITGVLTIKEQGLIGRVKVNGPGRFDGYLDLHNQSGARIWYSGSIGGTPIRITVR